MNPRLLNARNAQPKRPAIQLGNITIAPGSGSAVRGFDPELSWHQPENLSSAAIPANHSATAGNSTREAAGNMRNPAKHPADQQQEAAFHVAGNASPAYAHRGGKVTGEKVKGLWCFLCLLGYVLGQAVAAFVALLYAGLKWPFVAVVKAIAPRRVTISAREVGNGC